VTGAHKFRVSSALPGPGDATGHHEFSSLNPFDLGEQRRRFEIAARLLAGSMGDADAAQTDRASLVADDVYFSIFTHGLPDEKVAAEAVIALAEHSLYVGKRSRVWTLLHAAEATLNKFAAESPRLQLLRARILARDYRFTEAYEALGGWLRDPSSCPADSLSLGLFILRTQQRDRDFETLCSQAKTSQPDLVAWHEAVLALLRGQPPGALAAAFRKEHFEPTAERKLKAWLYLTAAGESAVAALLQTPKNVKRHHIRVKRASADAVSLSAVAEFVERLSDQEETDPFRSFETLRASLGDCCDAEMEMLLDAASSAACCETFPSLSRETRAAYHRSSLVLLNGSHTDALMLTGLWNESRERLQPKTASSGRRPRPILSPG
jgi:hypothetical protein